MGKFYLLLLLGLTAFGDAFPQTYNDGPIELIVRVREVKTSLSSSDLNLGFSPDDFTYKVWARDNINMVWQGGGCLTSDFDPPGISGDLNTILLNNIYSSNPVPGLFDIRFEGWEDDLPTDNVGGVCGMGSRCTYTANACCVNNPFGGCLFDEGDDDYCAGNPFQTGLNYRLGNPCQWYDHGYITGSCGTRYQPRIESYWRYINGDNCSNAIDLGTLASGATITHDNSTICYNNDYGDPGNDVFVSFTINQAMGVRVTICGGATFNTTLFLLDENCNQLYVNRDDPNCSPQSTIAENLCTPGNYYVVIDGSTTAEQGRFRLTIVEDPSLSLVVNTSKSDVSCNGLSNGTATASVSGGTTPYQYLWTPGNFITASITGLAAGNYIVQVTDARNCVAYDTVAVTQPPAVAINSIIGFDPICNGESTGEITVPSVSGGTPPYQYSVTGFYQPTSTFVDLAAGPYTATVIDALGCYDTASVTLNDPPRIAGNLSSTPETCSGFSDGTITVNPEFGAHPYYCAIGFPPIFGACTGVYENLAAGDYVITIKDANDCQVFETIEVELVPALTLSLVSKTDVSCFGGNDGEIRVTSANGAPPRLFSIDGGVTFQSDSVFTGLTANLYTVLVQDSYGCQNMLNVQVSEPSLLVPSELFQISVTCNGEGDGLMVITASGGTGPYQYSIDGVNFYQSGAFSYLAGGAYNFTVVDDHYCTATLTATMFEPDVLAVTAISSTNASCGGIHDGTLTLGASGGTAPFKFSINNGPFQSSPIFTGLAAGTYLIGVEDRNDCVAFDSATIGLNVSLSATVVTTDVLCHGENTGEITISNVSGGTPPYEYSINNVIFQPSPTFSALAAGNYIAIARDINGCQYIESMDIHEPPLLTAVVDSTVDATCPGIQDGAIYITASGGNGSYAYSWSNSLQTEDIVNVAGGNYMVTVKDGNNCEFMLSASIDQPNTTYIDVTRIENVSCFGENDGHVDIDVTGGLPPFSYRWSDNSTNQDLLDVGGGIYLVTVTDAAGCEAYDTVEVLEPEDLISSVTATDVSCETSAEADITLTVSGGTPPYDFMWSNFVFTQNQTDVPAGAYSVIITDDNGCRETNSIVIATAPGLEAILNVTNISCFGANDGIVEISVNGGTQPYVYNWSNSRSTPIISGLSAGIYAVTVTDSVQCTGVFSALIEEPEELKVQISSTDVLCHDDNSGLAIPFVTGGTGANTFLWNTNPPSDNPVQTNLSEGTYILEVRDENNCLALDTVVIGEPSPLSVSIAGTDNVICLSGTDGEVTVRADGGVPPYQYSVIANRFQTDSVFTGLEAGDYGVMVLDENGCMATSSFTLTESDGFEVKLPPFIFIALGASDTLEPELISADSIVDIQWTPADFLSCTKCLNPVVSPIEDRAYTLVVTDINGCKAVEEVTVAVKTEYEVYMPNVFTPNGDGNNDTYYPIDLGAVRNITFKIFNRWGAVIFETTSISQGWDGKFKGEELNPGVFLYHITGEFLDGNTFNKVGTVTLIR